MLGLETMFASLFPLQVTSSWSKKDVLTDDILPLTQASPESNKTGAASIPPPLNIPPSRARRQLAARLAARKEAEAAENDEDPDAADSAALEAASLMSENPDEGDIDLGPATERDINEATSAATPTSGLNITGLRTVGGLGEAASRFSGLFTDHAYSSDSSGDEDEDDEDDAGRDHTVGRPEGDYEDSSTAESMSPVIASGSTARRPRLEKARRQSTTEAKTRTPLDDDDDDEVGELERDVQGRLVLGGDNVEDDRGPFADPIDMRGSSSDEDELVEIRPRRTS